MKYDIIKPYIDKGLISECIHPEDENVRIYNYTQHCQFEGAWDEVTMQCRGLILNVATGEIIARPFPKFFNYQEIISKGGTIPTEKPIVTSKLDGSLGILYELNGEPWIATRGSFKSDQALWATHWWRQHVGMLPGDNETHLFEIIYPENRIVVNYDFSGLVHIATLDTKKGIQVPFTWLTPVRTVSNIPITDLVSLAKMDEPNSEGFVAYFPIANTRLKIKFPEYVRLHKLVTGVSEIAIWEHLMEGNKVDDLLEKVPDEFFKWVKGVEKDLRERYKIIEDDARIAYMSSTGLDSRKAQAENIQSRTRYSGIAFQMLDGKNYTKNIWRLLRPHGQKLFKSDIDL